MSKTLRNVATGLCAAALLVQPGPAKDKEQLSVKVPAQYQEAQTTSTGCTTVGGLADWWKTYNDPELQWLIERAMKSNLDVRLAKAKLAESRATAGYTRNSLELPTVNTDASYTRSRTSLDNPQIPKLGGNDTLIPTTYGVYQAYFDASYEIDIFGGVRNQVKAARADAAASADDLRNTLVSTLAEVARDYIQLRQYQAQLKVAQDNEASQKDTLKITKVRYKAGLVSDLDVANASANVAETQSSIPTLQKNISQEIHAIAVLLGQNPENLTSELSPAAALPEAKSEIPAGMSSDLLRRRPDIREAEKNVEAASARVGVQVAKLFPTFSLSAQYGGQSGSITNIVAAAARYFSIGPTVEWGILNYPSLRSNINVYKAKRDEQVVTYQKTVLTAFQDVEDALVAYTREREREATLEKEVDQYRRAASISMTKYTRGLSTFLDVLTAQRSQYNAEDALVQSKAAVQVDLISLYKALGGGWEDNDPAMASQRSGAAAASNANLVQISPSKAKSQ
jgi:NodT family efflux transporter outer membrane factor (OMF) lipoprotein